MELWTDELRRSDMLLYGRVTYDLMRGGWRRPESDVLEAGADGAQSVGRFSGAHASLHGDGRRSSRSACSVRMGLPKLRNPRRPAPSRAEHGVSALDRVMTQPLGHAINVP